MTQPSLARRHEGGVALRIRVTARYSAAGLEFHSTRRNFLTDIIGEVNLSSRDEPIYFVARVMCFIAFLSMSPSLLISASLSPLPHLLFRFTQFASADVAEMVGVKYESARLSFHRVLQFWPALPPAVFL